MKKTGLTAYQIKLIALFAMTLDHLGAYGTAIPMISNYSFTLRILGRMAAPLFLFALTESIHHTHNRFHFILRLYFASVGVGLFTTLANYLFWDSIGRRSGTNIMFTYFYVAVYITVIEEFVRAVQNRKITRVIGCLFITAATFLAGYVSKYLRHVASTDLAWDIVDSFILGPLEVEYSILFVVMGILMYFPHKIHVKVLILAVFSLGCFYGDHFREILLMMSPDPYYAYPQCWMILALPIMLLYNGERGNGHKYFFYIYYPLHRYLISIVNYACRILLAR